MTNSTDTMINPDTVPEAPYLTLRARPVVEDDDGDLVDGKLPEGESLLIHIPFDDFETLTGEDAQSAASGTEPHVFDPHVEALTRSAHAPRWMHDFDGTLAVELHGVESGVVPTELPPGFTDMTVTFVVSPIAKAEDGTIVHEPIPEGEHDDITLSLGQLLHVAEEQPDDLILTLRCRALANFYLDSILKFSAAPRWARDRYARLKGELGDLWFLEIESHFEVKIIDEDYAALDAAYATLV